MTLARASEPNREGARIRRLLHLTSGALIVLTVLLLALVLGLVGQDHASVRAVLAHPVVAGGLGLYMLVTVVHMRIGMQEILADYVRGSLLNVLAILNWLFALFILAASLFALAKLTLGF